jgi:hypothetical protein
MMIFQNNLSIPPRHRSPHTLHFTGTKLVTEVRVCILDTSIFSDVKLINPIWNFHFQNINSLDQEAWSQ